MDISYVPLIEAGMRTLKLAFSTWNDALAPGAKANAHAATTSAARKRVEEETIVASDEGRGETRR
jgi:hypothetical protein